MRNFTSKIAVGLLISGTFATTASAQDMFTEGFHFDNAVRQACNPGPDYDSFMTPMMTERFGFEEVDAPEGVTHRFEHPLGMEIEMFPEATETPQCVMTIAAGVLNDELWSDFLESSSNSAVNNELPAPEETETGLVVSFTSWPDTFLNIEWETVIIRDDDGATTIERRFVELN